MPPTPNQRIVNKGDWRLGIVQTYWGATSNRSTMRQNGAATVQNTYRCFANPDGVLGPLPLIEAFKTIDTDTTSYPDDFWAGAGGSLSNFNYVPINDMVVIGPVNAGNNVNFSIDRQSAGAHVYIAWTMRANITGANAIYQVVRKYDRNAISVNASINGDQDIFLNKYAYTGGWPIIVPRIVLGKGRSTYDSTPALPPAPAAPESLPARLIISVAGHSVTQWNTTTPPVIGALAANDATAFAIYNAETKTTYSYTDGAAARAGGSLFVYPGYAADPVPVQTGPIPLDSGAFGANNSTVLSSYLDFVTHQGRVVGIVQGAPVISGNTAFFTPGAPTLAFEFLDSQLTYTLYPDWIVHAVSPVMFHANPENTSGLGSIGSINASQLLLIKNHGGGLVINGSLNDPTVVQLPYLESTYGLNAHGVNTPIGYVYTSRNGIFAWTGGETSDKLSDQMDGRFWNDWTESDVEYTLMGMCARLAYWEPWVVVPNNYFYDIRTKAWWRFELPDTPASGADNLAYAFADVAPVNNELFLAPYAIRFTEGQNSTFIGKAIKDSFASSYSFQSQPLVETEMVLTEITEFILKAQRQDTTGTATITITLSGYMEDGTAVTPVVTTYTFPANTLINTYRIAVGHGGSGTTITAKSIQYRIEVSNTSFGEAPIIHDLDFVTIPQSGELPFVT